jgi:hypothetical protein
MPSRHFNANYFTHKTPQGAGLAQEASSLQDAWLNLVERFFAKITTRRIRRRAFTPVAELERPPV